QHLQSATQLLCVAKCSRQPAVWCPPGPFLLLTVGKTGLVYSFFGGAGKKALAGSVRKCDLRGS
ncbi:MAG TPA: hypothetical protein DCR20_14860, partial [Planctomycetaceae bacterium]|nr:hypothetical protein [Planctomycetaceae bacterium]